MHWGHARWFTTNWKRPNYPLIAATRSNLRVRRREEGIQMKDTCLGIKRGEGFKTLWIILASRSELLGSYGTGNGGCGVEGPFLWLPPPSVYLGNIPCLNHNSQNPPASIASMKASELWSKTRRFPSSVFKTEWTTPRLIGSSWCLPVFPICPAYLVWCCALLSPPP